MDCESRFDVELPILELLGIEHLMTIQFLIDRSTIGKYLIQYKFTYQREYQYMSAYK